MHHLCIEENYSMDYINWKTSRIFFNSVSEIIFHIFVHSVAIGSVCSESLTLYKTNIWH